MGLLALLAGCAETVTGGVLPQDASSAAVDDVGDVAVDGIASWDGPQTPPHDDAGRSDGALAEGDGAPPGSDAGPPPPPPPDAGPPPPPPPPTMPALGPCGEGSDAPPNVGVGYDRIYARIRCETAMLRYRPNETANNQVISGVDGRTPTLLRRDRHVMIQGRPGASAEYAPGNVDGYVWINPDYGNYSTPSGTDRATYNAAHPAVGRRGWVPDGCLETLPGESERVPRPGEGTFVSRGNGRPWHIERAVATQVVACRAMGTYAGIRPDLRDEDFTYRPYGNGDGGDPAVSIAYSTTTVEGGGTIFGYFLRGDTFHAVCATGRDTNQLSDGAPAARWAYGYGDLLRDGRSIWGWVWLGCLGATTPPPPPPSGTCYARCCSGSLLGPSAQGSVSACGAWAASSCGGAGNGLRRAELNGAPAADLACGCFVRCCDGSLHRFDARSREECRGDYEVCARRGRVRAMEYGGENIYTGSCG